MKRSPLRKHSKTTYSKLLRQAETAVKAFVRERDIYCQAQGAGSKSCGGYLQCSHIYPEGLYYGMRLDPLNIILMCYTHHIYWWHKNPIEAKEWIDNYLTQEHLEYLKLKSQEYHKFTEEELRRIIVQYGEK